MDPVSAVSLAGSVIGIIDVATRSISALRKIQERWKNADINVSVLLGQLVTLKAALDQISTWVSTKLAGAPRNYEIIFDLDAAVQNCRFLLAILDDRLSTFEWNGSSHLAFESRVKAVFESSNTKEWAVHLSHQSAAMTLLLTAMNCQSVSDQMDILECKENRKILDQIKDDSSSLICHRDSSSLRDSIVATTDRSSMLSKEFDFDAAILGSKVYMGQIRSLLRRASKKSKQVSNHNPLTQIVPSRPAVEAESLAIKSNRKDPKVLSKEAELLLLGSGELQNSQSRGAEFLETAQSIRNGPLTLREEVKLLVVGCSGSDSSQLLNTLRISLSSRYSLEERKSARKVVHSMVHRAVSMILEKIDTANVQAHDNISKDLAYSIGSLWKSLEARRICAAFTEAAYRDSTMFFLGSIERITQSDYLPDDYDMAKPLPESSGLQEATFVVEQKTTKLLKPNMSLNQIIYYLPSFEDVTATIFLVDLSTYDNAPDWASNRDGGLEVSLWLFRMINNSICLENRSVILFLTNFRLFEQKLRRAPLQKYFPDFGGGADARAAVQYVSEKFRAMKMNGQNRVKMSDHDLRRSRYTTYIHVMDLHDVKVIEAIKGNILDITMREDNGLFTGYGHQGQFQTKIQE
ncbi:guanine nucleotide-binding protein subunit alpha [Lecanora helva]